MRSEGDRWLVLIWYMKLRRAWALGGRSCGDLGGLVVLRSFCVTVYCVVSGAGGEGGCKYLSIPCVKLDALSTCSGV